MWMQYHSTTTPALGRNNDKHVSTTANTPHVSAWRIVCRSDDCCKPELCNCYKHITVTADPHYSSIIWCVKFTISLLIPFITFHFEVYLFLLTKATCSRPGGWAPWVAGKFELFIIVWSYLLRQNQVVVRPILSLRKDRK